jgi:hypothetical protein
MRQPVIVQPVALLLLFLGWLGLLAVAVLLGLRFA